MIQVLGSMEIQEVVMICIYFKWLDGPFKQMSPFVKCADDCQQLLVIDQVVALFISQTLGYEANWMVLTISLLLR